jgi:hypothetical protein
MFLLSILRGANNATGGLYDYVFVHFIARYNRNCVILAARMPNSKLYPDLRFSSKVVKKPSCTVSPANIHENYCPLCLRFFRTVFFLDTEPVFEVIFQNGASCRI